MEIALVYMVAGMSSRFGGKIKQFAKVTENETLIEYSLKQALPAGFTKIVFIVGNKTETPFKEMFGSSFKGIPVEYALQTFGDDRERPWGSADAICSAKSILNCPFIVCNGDDLYGENSFKTLVNHLKNSEQNATLGFRLGTVIPEKGKVNRGIFQIDDLGNVINLEEVIGIEKTNLESLNITEESLCSMNIFALHPKVIDLLDKRVKEFKKENKGDRKIEIFLPTEISNLIENNEISVKIYPAKDQWFGVTNPEDEEVIRKLIASNLF